MYYDINTRRGETELGVMIGDREYWGRGYGTDSVLTLVGHIFTTMSLNRVYLHTLEWNARARRSFAKAGFRELRNVRRNGMDFVLMEIWRTQWEQRSSETDRTAGREARWDVQPNSPRPGVQSGGAPD
jgi:RimJ/RimL family protein N-acetyltransferase